MISLSHVAKSFGEINVLEDVTFTLKAGDRASLLGPGGCGKSTILKMLLGLVKPDRGHVMLMGTEMVKATDDEKQKVLRKVGMAFQQGALFDFMTVKDNLAFAMEHMTDLAPEAMEERIRTLLEGVKLGKTADLFPYELSGGMQRRVGIARALATDPEVAIFDEPTAGLDPVTSTIILNMILQLSRARAGTTSLIATSNVEIALRFADRVLMVNDGSIVADGMWRELLLKGSDWVRNFLSVRLIGLDFDYAKGLNLPAEFLETWWDQDGTPRKPAVAPTLQPRTPGVPPATERN